MKYYYQNPKTRDLIIVESEKGSILIIEEMKNVQFFLSEDREKPIKDIPKVDDTPASKVIRAHADIGKSEKGRGRRKEISEANKERVFKLIAEGKKQNEVAEEVGISNSTVCQLLKKAEIINQ